MSQAPAGAPLFSLPIETLNREFHGKALLAAKAVDRGWAVLIGKQSRVCEVMPYSPPGIHLEISIPEAKLDSRIRPLTDAGHHLACLCEEGIIYPDGADYCLRKVGPASLSFLSLYFANGQKQADDVCANRDTSHLRLVVTGNPRFDLLKPPYRSLYNHDASKIRAKIGAPFVLVNTNLSWANPHPSYGDFFSRLKHSGKVVTKHQEELWKGLISAQMLLLKDFQRISLDLVKAGFSVVIRPHPSENHQFWTAFAANQPRLHVIHEGSANAWILASEVVVHSGCTTGVEAFLLGKPVIAYLPEYVSEDKCFSNRLSVSATSPQQLLSAVLSFMGARSPLNCDEATVDCKDGASAELALYHIANSDEPFACSRILDALEQVAPPVHPYDLLLHKIKACRRPVPRRLASRLLGAFLAALPDSATFQFLERRRRLAQLNQQKFPGLDRDDLIETFGLFRDLGFVSVMPHVEKIDSDLFLVTPPRADGD